MQGSLLKDASSVFHANQHMTPVWSCQRTMSIGVRLAAASGWACLLSSCQKYLKVAAASSSLHSEHACMYLILCSYHLSASI